MNNFELKQTARQLLSGYWLRAVIPVAAIEAASSLLALCTAAIVALIPELDQYISYVVLTAFSELGIVFAAPLSLGFKKMMWKRALGETPPLSDMFELYGAPVKLIKYCFLALIRGALIVLPAVLFNAPGVILEVLKEHGFALTGLPGGVDISSLVSLAALGLGLAGYALSLLVLILFFASDYLIIYSGELVIFRNLRESLRVIKGNVGRVFSMYLSFFGWLLLNLTGFGMLYTKPYLTASSSLLARELIESRKASAQEPYIFPEGGLRAGEI